MNTFTAISIVTVTLFIMVILVVDHVEVARHARMMQQAQLQEWKRDFDIEQRRQALLNEIGQMDPTTEERTDEVEYVDVLIRKIIATTE